MGKEIGHLMSGPDYHYIEGRQILLHLKAIVDTPLLEGGCFCALDAEIPVSEDPGTHAGLDFSPYHLPLYQVGHNAEHQDSN